jgi:alpha-D-ribose 1-methylphosphonate 5-triphosphate synthase subunit PhnH
MRIDPIWTQPVQQRLFRHLLDVMARPGTVSRDAALLQGRPAWLGLLATLLDGTVSIADRDGLMDDDSLRLCEAPATRCEEARFILADGGSPPDFKPLLGTLESPELGATVILRVAEIGAGATALTLTGPGIDGHRRLVVDGLDAAWLEQRQSWCAHFPQGIDIILADSDGFAALSRTTSIALTEKGDS